MFVSDVGRDVALVGRAMILNRRLIYDGEAYALIQRYRLRIHIRSGPQAVGHDEAGDFREKV